MDRRLSNWSVIVLVLIGVWLLVSPLAPRISGYEWVARAIGGEEALSRFFLAFLFLYFAGIVKEKNHLRETLRGMVAIIKKQLEGRAASSVKEAVEILIRALASDDSETKEKVVQRLQKLTGQSFGDDRSAWESWWSENRESFEGLTAGQ